MDMQQISAVNAQARALIVNNAMPMVQPIYTGTVTMAAGVDNVITVAPRLTGLITGFTVVVSGTLNNTGASIANRTNWGAANAVKRFTFIDLNNQTRVNTSGWHMAAINTARLAQPAGGAAAFNLPNAIGNNFSPMTMGSTIAATTGTTAVQYHYYVPVSYSETDLRGAIYAQIINATMQLQISVNGTPGYTTGNSRDAMAGGTNTAVAWSSGGVTVTVYQHYYDQLPKGQNGAPVLPILDMSTMYMLQDTNFSPLVVNSDNTFAYANARAYLSTLALYDNNGTFNTGSDVDYFALQYANLTRQWQLGPQTIAFRTRNQIMADFPPAVYYFSHRDFPISTASYGNCELVLRPTAVTAGATLYVGYEMFAQQQTIVSASSLAQGA